jgi:hypothetical protein
MARPHDDYRALDVGDHVKVTFDGSVIAPVYGTLKRIPSDKYPYWEVITDGEGTRAEGRCVAFTGTAMVARLP